MDKVINCFTKKPDAVARLVCFPWAGGGSIHYARWGRVFNDSIEGNAIWKRRRRGRLCIKSIRMFTYITCITVPSL